MYLILGALRYIVISRKGEKDRGKKGFNVEKTTSESFEWRSYPFPANQICGKCLDDRGANELLLTFVFAFLPTFLRKKGQFV